MRRISGVLVLVSILIAACGGGAGGTATPGGPTQAPGATTTPAPVVTTPPAAGGTTVAVTITGGPKAGSYTGTADPSCALGFMGEGNWSANYTIFEGSTESTLSEVVLVYYTAEDGIQLSVGVGPIYDTANGFVEHEVFFNKPGWSDDGTGSVELNDAGATATLHAIATTADGVGLDVTVNCPSVTRG